MGWMERENLRKKEKSKEKNLGYCVNGKEGMGTLNGVLRVYRLITKIR